EEKMLPACLAALKPLLDAVPSELVIVDTGSADKTVEIAQGYTDKVFHFDWVNDFAAARNFGLEKCKGMWFMFVDADEHFVDVREMVEFFNNAAAIKEYNTAYYTIRNFTAAGSDKYSEFSARRLARRAEDLRFEGAIHENFAVCRSPVYYFSSYANHYGYSFGTGEGLRSKSERNLKLIRAELEKDPDNVKSLGYYITCLLSIDDKERAIIERAADLADKSDSPFLYSVYFNSFTKYKEAGDFKAALDTMDRAVKKAPPDSVVLAEAYAGKAALLYSLGKYAEAEQSIRSYLDYHKKYKENKLDKTPLVCLALHYLGEEARAELLNILAFCVLHQSRTEEALAVYDDENFTEISADIFKGIVSTAAEIAKETAARPKFLALYEKAVKTGISAQVTYFEQALERLYYFDSTFAESFEGVTGRFAELMRICADGVPPLADNKSLEEFLGRPEPLTEGYSEAMYLALKHNHDLTNVIAKLNYEQIRSHLAVITVNRPELSKVAVQYKNDDFFFSSIKNLLFGVMLFEVSAIGAGAQRLSAAEKPLVCENYSKYASLYVANVYNPGLLNETDISALPETHRFGFFMGAARKEFNSGNKLGYVKELKKALASCNSMQSVISFLLEEFSRSL
ncbi:MAG: glycosyltransferase, partial [Oscillospiraceae bacterium]|nr:glycosyltransferase [Oscillospiraceae bacterium]